jgi:soluble lytic murein transglycosylase-like protein
MFDSKQFNQSRARVLRQESATASTPTLAAIARHGATSRTALFSLPIAFLALLLSACGTSLPTSDGSHGLAYNLTRSETAKPKQMRATRMQDILAEWGTFGVESPVFRKDRATVTARRNVLPSPDYSESIQQIIDNATCHACEQKPYHRMVVNASVTHGVPSSLIHAVIQKESGYNAHARSPRNARGLMQVTPETARFVGVSKIDSLYDPQTNINAGTAYLNYLMRTHDTFDEVLAAYNAGPGNVRKYNGVPPFNETRRYVRDVRKFFSASTRNVSGAKLTLQSESASELR